MKIIRVDSPNRIEFGDIKVGECFEWGNELHIKINELPNQDNALSLEHIRFYKFDSKCLVYQVDAEINYKYKWL